jgi:hypothetical protein
MLDKYVTLEPLSPVIRMVINKKPKKPIKPKNPIKPTVGWALKKKKNRVFLNPVL